MGLSPRIPIDHHKIKTFSKTIRGITLKTFVPNFLPFYLCVKLFDITSSRFKVLI